jgi:Ca2+-binding RTX toxin-like protein
MANQAPKLTGKKAVFAAGQENLTYTFNVQGKAGLLAGFTDADKDTLSVTNVTANHGTMSFDAKKNTYTLTPEPNYSGLVTLNYNVIDGKGAVVPATQSLTLNDVNVGGVGNDTLDGSNTNSSLSWQANVVSLNNYKEPAESLSNVIKNGALYISPSLSSVGYYWSSFTLPLVQKFNGDDFKLELRIKNPAASGGLSAYDVSLAFSSSVTPSNGAGAAFMDGSWAIGYTGINALGKGQNGFGSMVVSLSDWHTLSIETKGQIVTVYYDGKQSGQYAYNGKIGDIDTLSISTKGSGSLDWVKAYANGQLIMNDDFNSYNTGIAVDNNAILKGGKGNDTYIVDSSGDKVVENLNEGDDDTVKSSISYTLPKNVENLVLTGQAVNGSGNELNNKITGNALNNTLNGGAGNDTAIYSGSSSGYKFEFLPNSLKITDTNLGDGNDGTDTLMGIETLQFVDGVFDSSQFQPKLISEIFNANGYYSTFADLAKAAYHLAPEEQLHKDQSKYVAQSSVNGDGQNYVKPYADEAWARIDKNWAVLKPSDLRVETSGTYHWIKTDGKVEIIKYDPAWGTATDTMESDLPNGNASFWFEPDGVYHGNNAAAFAVRSKDSVVISFRGTNDNDGEGLPIPFFKTADEFDWTNMDAHYGELLEFTNEIDMYVRDNGIKNVYVTGHSLGGGMALAYMLHHPKGGSVNYEAVTFAAPAYSTISQSDDRIISIEMDGDLVPDTGGYHEGRIVTVNSQLYHDNSPTKGAYGGTDYHSMDIYMAAAHALDSQLPDTTKTIAGKSIHGFDLNLFDSLWEAQVQLPMFEDLKVEGIDTTWDGKIAPKYVTMIGNNQIDGSSENSAIGWNKNIMIGGVGNDTYDVDDKQDVIIEKTNSGTDSVNSSVSFALPANVENLTLKADSGFAYFDGDINATGNELNNTLKGNDGDNLLIGGLGADTLTGGGGADTFKLNSINESKLSFDPKIKTTDTITDFNHGQNDRIDLSGMDANTSTPAIDKFQLVFSRNFPAPGELFFDKSSQILYGNTTSFDGFAIQLSGVSSLEAIDFIL